jgi:sugar O-acyltransferase (sialic acid O-acetyltransferase NeuD family)
MSEAPLLVLLGGGGHAAVVAEAARAAGWNVGGFLDDDPQQARAALIGHVRLGGIEDLDAVLGDAGSGTVGHAAAGSAALRRRWLDALGDRVAGPIVHPDATVSPSAALADGVFVGPRAIVNAGASVGRGAIVNSGAIVEHDCVLGDCCHVAPGAVLGGGAVIGPAALVGINAAVLPEVRIGAEATVGAGAVAVSEVPDATTATGIPARHALIAPKY